MSKHMNVLTVHAELNLGYKKRIKHFLISILYINKKLHAYKINYCHKTCGLLSIDVCVFISLVAFNNTKMSTTKKNKCIKNEWK